MLTLTAGSQDLSPLHQVTADMTTMHITSSTRVKDEFGRELWKGAQGKGAKQNQDDRCKNEPTSLVGLEQNAAGTQPTY